MPWFPLQGLTDVIERTLVIARKVVRRRSRVPAFGIFRGQQYEVVEMVDGHGQVGPPTSPSVRG